MNLELSQKQTTNLVITSQVRQAIQLLQYSAIDITSYIQELSVGNPLLEVTPPAGCHSVLTETIKSQKEWRESLNEEINWILDSKEEKVAMRYLILNLDERGLLSLPVQDIADQFGLSLQVSKGALRILRQYEGRGFGCLDTEDYLHVQLDNLHIESAWVEWIQTHLDDLLHQRLHTLLTEEEMNTLYKHLQSIPPYPAYNYVKEDTEYIHPEFICTKDVHGWTIASTDDLLPEVHIDYTLLNRSDLSDEDKSFLKTCHDQALWLIKSLRKRSATLLLVGESLLRKQSDFLEEGYLKPLTLREVAEDIEVHESTVSRAIANKYIQTPRGTVAMKSLFSSSLKKGQEEVSSRYVKGLIRSFIQKEDSSLPISDQKLSNLLKESHGITVSRRTVAKYRESMSIPSSTKRKKFPLYA